MMEELKLARAISGFRWGCFRSDRRRDTLRVVTRSIRFIKYLVENICGIGCSAVILQYIYMDTFQVPIGTEIQKYSSSQASNPEPER